jgi:8-oxo-dGTP pyrophosphatase MutT (NUDIX family)
VFGRSGDGFMRCSDGHVRWGIFGAAGVVFVHRGGDAPTVMLQKRSAFAHEGGTWSCAGGALDDGETPVDGALREASEEVGAVPAGHRVVGEYVFAPASDWTYTTVVVEVPVRFGRSMNFETDDVEWVRVPDVDHRPLHPGFAAAWPHLRRIIDGDDAA